MTLSSIAATIRAAAVALAFVASGAVLAQTPPSRLPSMATQPPGAPAAPAAPAPAPAAPKIEKAHLDLATEVLRLSGMARSIDLFAQMRPDVATEIDTTIKNLEPFWQEQNDLAIRLGAEAFAISMPEADLKELKTFFSSDVGKKFVAAQPNMLGDMMRNLDTFSARLSTTVVDAIQTDLKKRNVPF
jgi:hypothetical protein